MLNKDANVAKVRNLSKVQILPDNCTVKRSLRKTDAEFEEWQMEHSASGEYDINFRASSPAMEAEGARMFWGRSPERHNIRYKKMFCKGGSKAFNAVHRSFRSSI